MRNATPTEVVLRIGASLDLDTVLREVAERIRALNGDAQVAASAVTGLRRKLGEDAMYPRYVLGERGMGYRMPEPDGV